MFRLFVYIVVLNCLLAGNVFSATGSLHIRLAKEPLIDVAVNIPRGKAAGKYDVAVLIANQDYQKGIPSVDYALNDLKRMHQYLQTTMGFDPDNILVEKNAGKSTFEILFGINCLSLSSNLSGLFDPLIESSLA